MSSIELEITDLAFGGAGVGRYEGKAIFVPFTLPGEKVRARIWKQKKNFAQAELTEILEPSKDRQEAPCAYFGVCGGCAYQHLPYPLQLKEKERQVEQVLLRLGGLKDIPLKSIIPAPAPFGYRNRITVHRSGRTTGFYDRKGHKLVDIDQCLLASKKVNSMLERLRVTRVKDGNYRLSEPLSAGGFHQTNTAVAKLLLEKVASLCPQGYALFIDAYCGAGAFAKKLAPHFERVVGIEWSHESLLAARRSALEKETYIQGDVAEELASVLEKAPRDTTLLLVDPPATGLEKTVIAPIIENPPASLIYVSCNPSTLARDLRILTEKHFVLKEVTPIDMFPQTAEIEVVVELRKKAA